MDGDLSYDGRVILYILKGMHSLPSRYGRRLTLVFS